MTYSSALLIFFVTGCARAYLGDPLPEKEDVVTARALEFTVVDREPIDSVPIVLEESTTTTASNDLEWTTVIHTPNNEYGFNDLALNMDAPSPSSGEHPYGFERGSTDSERFMKRPYPRSTNNVADPAPEEDEGNTNPIPTLDESEMNKMAVARRLRRRNVATIKMGPRLADKENLRDFTVPLFHPAIDESGVLDLMPYAEPAYQVKQTIHEDGRILQNSCNSDQTYAKVEIFTDDSGFETSWKIRESNGVLVVAGPPEGTQYDDNKSYTGGICLDAGSYTFTVYDKSGDGMCGSNSGQGLYRFYLDGDEKFTSPSSCEDWAKRDHIFTIASTSAPNPSPSPPTTFQASSRSGCHNVKIDFKVDKFGKETTVLLSQNGVMALQSRNEVPAYQTKSMEACVSAGTYTFKLIDVDGICCHYGQGWYKLSIDGTPLISGGYFIGSKSYTVKVGYDWRSTMDARDKEWLVAHNDRRQTYNGGEGYVPLRWSQSLAYDAKSYAEVLKNGDCDLTHASHDPNTTSGENLASNLGTGTWGALRSADQVMTRWVDREANLQWGDNFHFLQVVWRATQYVGCGESVRYLSDGQICRVQVCRYERPGSCGVRNGDWRAEAWKDDTLCGNPCPNEGCYA